MSSQTGTTQVPSSVVIALESNAADSYRDAMTEILNRYTEEYFLDSENYPAFPSIRRLFRMSNEPLYGVGKIRDVLVDHIFHRHCLPVWWPFDHWMLTMEMLRVRQSDQAFRTILVAAKYAAMSSLEPNPLIAITHSQAELLSRLTDYEPR